MITLKTIPGKYLLADFINLSSGQSLLIDESTLSNLEAAYLVTAYQTGRLELSQKDYQTLVVKASTTPGSLSPEDLAKYATKTELSNLINGAPATLDTLKEISDWIASNEVVTESIISGLPTKVDKESGKGLSSNDYTSAEKTKLQGIATSANNYSLPVATATVLGGVKSGANLVNTAGVLSVPNSSVTVKGVVQLNNTVTSTATDVAATANVVKVAYDLAASKADKTVATDSAAGLMSSSDKTKLDSFVPTQLIKLTQSQYDVLEETVKNQPNTLFIIVDLVEETPPEV